MLVSVLVKPGSKKGPLVKVAPSSELVVYVREKAHDGEANKSVQQVLAEYFGVAKSCVILKSGAGTRWKKIEIIGR